MVAAASPGLIRPPAARVLPAPATLNGIMRPPTVRMPPGLAIPTGNLDTTGTIR
jgi:hypothetical protein